MPILHAIVLGIVQGLVGVPADLVERSPAARAVALRLGRLRRRRRSEKAFDVALHIGTLIAAIAYFRHDLVVYVREGCATVVHRQRPVTTDGRVAWLLVLSTVPAALVGAVFEDSIDEHLGRRRSSPSR